MQIPFCNETVFILYFRVPLTTASLDSTWILVSLNAGIPHLVSHWEWGKAGIHNSAFDGNRWWKILMVMATEHKLYIYNMSGVVLSIPYTTLHLIIIRQLWGAHRSLPEHPKIRRGKSTIDAKFLFWKCPQNKAKHSQLNGLSQPSLSATVGSLEPL